MIKYTENGATQNIIKVMKDGHEAHRMLHNDRLVFSPFLIMGTTYESTSKQMWSRGDSSQLGTDLYSTFEILGEAGEDEGGVYYNFGWRVTGVMRNGNRALQGHFVNELNYFFKQNYSPLTTYFRTVDQFNCTGNYSYEVIPVLGERTGLKEVDFKWFNCKDKSHFLPLAFATKCTSIKNLDKVTFNSAVNCRGGFSECPVDTFVWGSDTLYYINNLQQAWQNCPNVSLITFAHQDQDNTLCTNLINTFWNCTNVNRIDIANLRLVNLTDVQGAFRNCYNLYHNPLGGLPTSGITRWQSTYENCRTLLGSQFDTNDYSSAINMAACFRGCSGITSLDLSNKNLSNVANFDSTWAGCSQLDRLLLPQVKPTYMQESFRGTALYNIPSNIDFSDCLNTSSMCANCTNFEGEMNFSNHEFSAVTLSELMFYGCNYVYSYTFKQGAFHNSTNMHSMFERNTLLASISNLDMTSATNLNSMFYIDSNLVSVSGTAPSGIITQNGLMNMCSNCNSLETFPSLANLKLSNRANLRGIFQNCSKFKSNPHFETWTSADGVSKPVIADMSSCFNNFGSDVADNDKFTIDLSGWTFCTSIYDNTVGSGFNVGNCQMPLINLDKIKIRPELNSSGVELKQNFRGIFGNANIEEVDTTTWLDNSEIPTLTKLNGTTNYAMFQYSQPNTKLKKIILKNVKVDDDGYLCNLFTFQNCNGVTHFECDVDFFNASKTSYAFDLSPFINWVNSSQISTFLTDLSNTQCRRYALHNTPMEIKLSSNTYNVASSLSNWNTLSSAIASQGWNITHT